MINVSDLKKRLSVEILPVYFLKGQDAYVKELAIGVLKGLLDKDFADMNLTVFEDSSDMEAVVQTLNTVPVFDERRLVVVKSTEGLDDAGRAKLEAYLNNPSGFSVLAFSDDAIARDDFSKKASPVFKLYGKGEVVDVSGADEMQYPRIVENEVGKRNCTIENAAISLLSTYTARDMTRTMNEVNKLCAFKNGGKITKDDVENLVAADTEYKTYALADALSRGDNDRALDVLKTLLSDGESPSSILASMTAQYRRMFEARISSLSQDDLAKALSVRPGAISIAKTSPQGTHRWNLKSTSIPCTTLNTPLSRAKRKKHRCCTKRLPFFSKSALNVQNFNA